jgi:hypothetical protein
MDDKKNSRWWYHPQQVDFVASSNHVCKQHLKHSLPSTIEGRRRCNANRYDLTFFANHSLILETSNQFVQKIWLSHLHLQVEKHHLQQNQNIIWSSD